MDLEKGQILVVGNKGSLGDEGVGVYGRGLVMSEDKDNNYLGFGEQREVAESERYMRVMWEV